MKPHTGNEESNFFLEGEEELDNAEKEKGIGYEEVSQYGRRELGRGIKIHFRDFMIIFSRWIYAPLKYSLYF